MTRKKYKVRKGSVISDKDAQKVGEEIENLIKAKGGEVTPSEVLDRAQKPRNVMHRYFDWDDSSAAYKHRIQTARMILGSIIEVVIVDAKRHPVRSFFNVKNVAKESVYVTLKSTVNTPSYVNQILSDCENYITHFLSMIKILKRQIK